MSENPQISDELLPCPFCGEKRAELVDSVHEEGSPFVRCGNYDCGAKTEGHSTADAIAAWNRRATTDRSRAQPHAPAPARDLTEAQQQAQAALDKVMNCRFSNFDAGAVVHWAERGLYQVKTAPAPARDDVSAHPDDRAVDRFATAMKTKLAIKRDEGRGGWQDKEQCSAAYLSQMLREHVDKGDPIDVANLAMMLHQRGDAIAPAPARELVEALERAALTMERYRRAGLGDDVFHSDLCETLDIVLSTLAALAKQGGQ